MKLFIVLIFLLTPVCSLLASELDFKLLSTEKEQVEYEKFRSCIGESIEPFVPSTSNLSETLEAFADEGKSCLSSAARNTDDLDNTRQLCGCYNRKHPEILKWQVQSAVSSRVKGIVDDIIREELIKSARSRFLESFEAAQHVERLINEGKIRKEEVSGMASCSADSFTKSVFEELESRGQSCSPEAKKKGLKMMFGTTDRTKAVEFLSRLGNKIAKNAILPEHKSAGYCLGNGIVDSFSSPPIESKTSLGETSMTSIFDPHYAEDFSNVDDFLRTTKGFFSQNEKLVRYSFNAEDEEWPRRHIRGMQAAGEDMEAFLRKNPLVRIAAQDPKTYKLLQHLKPEQWKRFVENPKVLNKVIDGPAGYCRDIRKDGGDGGKALGDIICGSFKPQVDGHTFVTTILPRIWDKLGERDGNLIAINYATNNYCKTETRTKKRGRDKGKKYEAFSPKEPKIKLGHIEKKVFKLGAIMKSEIEKEAVPDEKTRTPSEYETFNKALCTENLFQGCSENPEQKKCYDPQTISTNIGVEIRSLLESSEFDVSDVYFSSLDGGRNPKSKEEVIEAILKNPELYINMARVNVSDEVYYKLKALTSAKFNIDARLQGGSKRFEHFDGIGKDTAGGRPGAVGIIANVKDGEVGALEDHHGRVRQTPVGQNPPEVPYVPRVNDPAIDRLLDTPTAGIDFDPNDDNGGLGEPPGPPVSPTPVPTPSPPERKEPVEGGGNAIANDEPKNNNSDTRERQRSGRGFGAPGEQSESSDIPTGEFASAGETKKGKELGDDKVSELDEKTKTTQSQEGGDDKETSKKEVISPKPSARNVASMDRNDDEDSTGKTRERRQSTGSLGGDSSQQTSRTASRNRIDNNSSQGGDPYASLPGDNYSGNGRVENTNATRRTGGSRVDSGNKRSIASTGSSGASPVPGIRVSEGSAIGSIEELNAVLTDTSKPWVQDLIWKCDHLANADGDLDKTMSPIGLDGTKFYCVDVITTVDGEPVMEKGEPQLALWYYDYDISIKKIPRIGSIYGDPKSEKTRDQFFKDLNNLNIAVQTQDKMTGTIAKELQPSIERIRSLAKLSKKSTPREILDHSRNKWMFAVRKPFNNLGQYRDQLSTRLVTRQSVEQLRRSTYEKIRTFYLPPTMNSQASR